MLSPFIIQSFIGTNFIKTISIFLGPQLKIILECQFTGCIHSLLCYVGDMLNFFIVYFLFIVLVEVSDLFFFFFFRRKGLISLQLQEIPH